MLLGRFPTLLLAAVLAGPALWHAAVTGDLDPKTALLRYLIAVPIAGVMLAFLRALVRAYQGDQGLLGSPDGQPGPPLRVAAVAGEPMPQRPEGDLPPESDDPADAFPDDSADAFPDDPDNDPRDGTAVVPLP
jgi:hypothetical protein